MPGVVMSPLTPFTFCSTQKAPSLSPRRGVGAAGAAGAWQVVKTRAVYVSLNPSEPGVRQRERASTAKQQTEGAVSGASELARRWVV